MVAVVGVILAGCSFTDEALIPSLTGESPSGNSSTVKIPPSAGEQSGQPLVNSTNFQVDNATPGKSTGTEVGRRVERLRGDLDRLLSQVNSHNSQLQSLRGTTVQNATRYQDLVAAIQTRLQIGTTPGNPNLVAQWNEAQTTLDNIGTNIGTMNNLANQVADNSALAAFILESVRATYGLTGAVDEDHAQLAVLEDETNRTVVLIDRLLNELNEDIARQTNYLSRERSNLTVLSLAVKNGELFGRSLANRAYTSAAPINSQPQRIGNLANRRPLVVIRFDRPDVPFEEPLYTAVNEALGRRPGAAFDLVAVTPQRGTPAQVALNASQSRRNAEKVLRTLTSMGLSTADAFALLRPRPEPVEG
ncbi:MAG: hypothetical protein VW644_08820 [Alphaproteobacteria bacterium]